MKCQFAEILVEGKQNAVVRHRAGEHLPVRNARCVGVAVAAYTYYLRACVRRESGQ